MGRSNEQSNRLLRSIGVGLVLLGTLLLALSERSVGEEQPRTKTDDLDQLSEGKTTTESESGQSHTAVPSITVGQLLGSVGVLFGLALLLKIPDQLIRLAVVQGEIPAGQFAPAVESGIIIGTLVSLGGTSLSVLSKRGSSALTTVLTESASSDLPQRTCVLTLTEDRASLIFRSTLTVVSGTLFILAWRFIVTNAYTPIQYIVSPNVVENLCDLSQWKASERMQANILSAAVATVLSLLFVQLVRPAYGRFRDYVDESLLG